MTGRTVHNFGKNVTSAPATFAEPQDEQELLELLGQHRDQSIRVVASRHAWSQGIQTDGLLISLKHFTHVRLNQASSTVSVGAGCQVKHLLRRLKKQQRTLPSVGLIDEQTIAGATATGTHGSGKRCLSHYVRRARVVHFHPETSDPTVTDIDAGADLQAARCSLGLLGVVVELEMETRSAYMVEEQLQRHRSLASMLVAEKEFPLQQFFLMPWSWQLLGQHRRETDQPRNRTAGLYGVYWHLGIDWSLHLVLYLLVKILRIRFLIRGFYRYVVPLVIIRKWRISDDSHHVLTMQHELFRHIEIEVFVARDELEAALDHVKQTIMAFGGRTPTGGFDESIPERHRGRYCHHYPICVRRVESDNTLISMASPRSDESDHDWYAISLISYEWPSRREGFFEFAEFVSSSMQTRFGARCHWGKYNPLDRVANEELYPKLDEFRNIVERFDPQGQFANDWLRNVLLSER